jgi:hypothetical protein
VVRKSLPLRPLVCTDEQWTLVTRMCAFDPSDRLNIGTVVDILGRLAGVGVSSVSKVEGHSCRQRPPRLRSLLRSLLSWPLHRLRGDAGTNALVVGLESVSATVAEMKSCIDAEHDAGPSSRRTLTQIFGLLWSRLDDLSRVVDDDICGDAGRLWELVDRSRQSTMAMQEQGNSESLIAFTETAMRGYALHRGLDKLMKANTWRVDSEEGDDVHDWRRRCNEFLGLAGDTSAVNETVKVLEALEVDTEQTTQAWVRRVLLSLVLRSESAR